MTALSDLLERTRRDEATKRRAALGVETPPRLSALGALRAATEAGTAPPPRRSALAELRDTTAKLPAPPPPGPKVPVLQQVWDTVKMIAADPGHYAKEMVLAPQREASMVGTLTPDESALWKEDMKDGKFAAMTRNPTAALRMIARQVAGQRGNLLDGRAAAYASVNDPVGVAARKQADVNTALNVAGLALQPLAGAAGLRVATSGAARLLAPAVERVGTLQAAQRAARVARGVGAVGGVLAGASADALIGAAQTPDNRAVGAILGGTLSVAGDAAMRAVVPAVRGAVRATAYAKQAGGSALDRLLAQTSGDQTIRADVPQAMAPPPMAPQAIAPPPIAPAPMAPQAITPTPTPRDLSLTFSDGTKVPARWRVMDADALQPSHNAFTFQENPAYPKGVQGRNYSTDLAAQQNVQRSALELDPDRLLDAGASPELGGPTITPDGVVVAGNQRSMLVQRAKTEAPARYASYVERLRTDAGRYGLSDADFEGVANPVLVREIDGGTPEQLGRLNRLSDQSATKAKSVIDDAASRATALRGSASALPHFVETMGRDESLATYLTGKNGRDFVRKLTEDGVIAPQEMGRYVDVATNSLTDEGKLAVRRMMLVSAVEDAATVQRAPDSILDKLEGAVPHIIRADLAGDADFKIGPVIKQALDLLSEARDRGTKLGDLIDQVDLDGSMVPEEVARMARFLDGTKKGGITDAFRKFGQHADESAARAASDDMFGGAETGGESAARMFGKQGAAPEAVKPSAPKADPYAEKVRKNAERLNADFDTDASADLAPGTTVTDGVGNPSKLVSVVRSTDNYDAGRGATVETGVPVYRFTYARPDAVPNKKGVYREADLRYTSVYRTKDGRWVDTDSGEPWITGDENVAAWGAERRARIAEQDAAEGITPVAPPTAKKGANPATGDVDARARQYVGESVKSQNDRGFKLERDDPEAAAYLYGTREGRAAYREEAAKVAKASYDKQLDQTTVTWANGSDGTYSGKLSAAEASARKLAQMQQSSIPNPSAKWRDANPDVDFDALDALDLDEAPAALGMPARRSRSAGAQESLFSFDAQRSAFDVDDKPFAGDERPRPLDPPRGGNAELFGQAITAEEMSARRDELGAKRQNIPQAEGQTEMPLADPVEPLARYKRKQNQQNKTPPPISPDGAEKRLFAGTEVLARRTIAQDLAKALGINLTEGRFARRVQGALGYMSPRTRELGVNRWDALRTAAHEIGHLLSARTHGADLAGTTGRQMGAAYAQFAATIPKVVRDELEAMGKALYGSRKPSSSYAEEGIAEAIAHFVTDPARLKAIAPNVTKWLDQTITKVPEVKAALTTAQERFGAWREGKAQDRVRALISVNEAKAGKARTMAGLYYAAFTGKGTLREAREYRAAHFQTVASNWLDSNTPINTATKGLTKRGWTLPFSARPDVIAKLKLGLRGTAEEALDHGVFDTATGERMTTGSVKEATKGLSRVELQDFRDYLVAKRYEADLHPRGIGLDEVTPDDAGAVVARLGEKFAARAKMLYDYQNALLDLRVRGGLLTAAEGARMKRVNKHRVGFYRVMDDAFTNTEAAGNGMGGGIAQQSSGVRAIRGSSRRIQDPLENIVMDTFDTLEKVQRQRVATALLDGALNTPEGGQLLHVVDTPEEVRKLFLDGAVVKQLQRMGFELAEDVADPIASGGVAVPANQVPKELAMRGVGPLIFAEDRMFANAKDRRDMVFPVLHEGGVKWVQTSDPALFQALTNHTGEASNFVLRAMSSVTRSLKAGVTLAPAFQVSNIMRDASSAAFWSRSERTLIVPGEHAARAAAAALGLDKDLWGRFKRYGGDNAAALRLDRRDYQHALSKLTNGRSIPIDTKRGKVKATLAVLARPLDLWRELGGTLENVTRAGEFSIVEREALRRNPGQPVEAAHMAGVAARDVSTDFSVMGWRGATVNKVVAFFNPNVQSTARFFREFDPRNLKTAQGRKRYAQLMARGATFVTAPSLGLWWLQKDDEVYQNVPGWIKKSAWVYVHHYDGADGEKRYKIIAIPKPFEVGYLFGTIPEMLAQYAYTQDPKALDGILTGFATTLLPPIIPTIAAPLVDVWRGKDSYRGRPINPPRSETQAKTEQAWDFTGETARTASRGMSKVGEVALGDPEKTLTPAEIEHIARGYTGTLGGNALEGVDAVVRGGRKLMGKAPLAPEKGLQREGMASVPFVGAVGRRFVRDEMGDDAESVQRAYREYDAAQRKHDTWRHKVRTESPEAEAYFAANRAALKTVATKKDVTEGYFEELGPLSTLMAEFREGKPIREEVLRSDLSEAEKKRRLRGFYAAKQNMSKDALRRASAVLSKK